MEPQLSRVTARRLLRAQTRRRGRWWRLLAAIVAIAVLGVTGVSVYVGWSLSHADRKPLDTDPSAYNLAYEAVEFLSAEDDITLRGWFLPAPLSEKTVILAHGFRDNRLESGVPMLGLAESLVKSGFNVLMFDFRNSGESDGTVTTLGYHEAKDIVGAVAYLKQQRPDAGRHIGLVGYSMGAVTAVIAAAGEPAIEAVVLDSPFADLRSYLQENMPVWTGLPDFPFTWAIMTILPPLIDLDIGAVSPLAEMPKLHQPVLLIHTDDDDKIPSINSRQLADAGDTARVELWLVPGQKHIGARQAAPAAYDQRLSDFLHQHVGDPARRGSVR